MKIEYSEDQLEYFRKQGRKGGKIGGKIMKQRGKQYFKRISDIRWGNEPNEVQLD